MRRKSQNGAILQGPVRGNQKCYGYLGIPGKLERFNRGGYAPRRQFQEKIPEKQGEL
jgi:hypothetical protein